MASPRRLLSRPRAEVCLAVVLVLALAQTPSTATGTGTDGLGLSAAARAQLAEEGFVVVPGRSGDFPEAYASLADRDLPVFVSADSVLRVADLLIDRVLRTIEETSLYDRLEQLSREMVRLLEDDYLRASDPMVKNAARRNLAFFAVGLSLLDADYFPPESVRGLVERELELIEASDRVVSSPIMGRTPLDQVVGPGEDYTQYEPTGHYAATERLRRYFRALTWYGRMAFALPERPVEDYTLTVQALLVVRALEREAGEWFELWERINYPLTFYHGGAGDPTVADYMEMADEVFGPEFERNAVASESLLVVFVDRVSEMAPSHVQTHELRGMRFLPRDFPPVTDYFGLLAGSEDRSLPTSLDIMSLLGSASARSLLDESDVFDDSVYRRSYASIERELETLTYGDWTRDLYWSWLYCLLELERPRAELAPEFTGSPAWGFKEISTGGAAWAGIRYQAADAPLTVVPAAQPLADSGVPALVEPYPGLYSRLRELMENLRDRLWEHYLLDDPIDAHITEFVDFLNLLERASGGILATGSPGPAGVALSDYARMLDHFAGREARRRPGELECVLVSAVAYEDLDTERLLQNAVGTPDIIYVRADIGSGETVYVGAVHSFFEMELAGREEMASIGWPTVLLSCPVNRPYWVSRFLVE
ncbi:MAG TPA: DUF3160 domain-containing protein [bacterium]|nr:DUF3160 domain-containing protein [bacterium]